MKHTVYKLRELCTFLSGGTPSVSNPEYWKGEICWVSPKDMHSEVIYETEDHISPTAISGSATKLVPANTILVVARSGILVRRLPISLTSKPMAFNQDIKAICVNEKRAIPRYIAYFLRSQESDILHRGVKKGATVHSLSSGYLEGFEVALPPLDEQQRIVDILDRAASIQRLRQAADEKLKQIIPALFVDMFGDPATNPKGFEKTKIGDHFLVKGGKRLPKGAQYSDFPTPHRYLRGTDIKANQIDSTNIKYITAEIHQGIKRYVVQRGDTVITIAGTIGVAAPVTEDLVGVNLTENAAMLRAKEEKRATPTYLSAFLNSPPAQSQIDTLTGRVTIGKLALERIEKIELLLPPLDAQLQFEQRLNELRSIQRLSDKATDAAILTAKAASATLLSSLNP